MANRSKSEARQVAAVARRIKKKFADSPIAGTAYRNALGEHCAPIVGRILGAQKRMSADDLATLATVVLADGDRDGSARNAVMLELARAGGVDRRSL